MRDAGRDVRALERGDGLPLGREGRAAGRRASPASASTSRGSRRASRPRLVPLLVAARERTEPGGRRSRRSSPRSTREGPLTGPQLREPTGLAEEGHRQARSPRCTAGSCSRTRTSSSRTARGARSHTTCWRASGRCRSALPAREDARRELARLVLDARRRADRGRPRRGRSAGAARRRRRVLEDGRRGPRRGRLPHLDAPLGSSL